MLQVGCVACQRIQLQLAAAKGPACCCCCCCCCRLCVEYDAPPGTAMVAFQIQYACNNNFYACFFSALSQRSFN
jgi:hypothetical protein